MHLGQALMAGSALLLLANCGHPVISAEPLTVSPADLAAAERSKKEFLGSLVFQSEQKCTAFVNNLVEEVGGINSAGDILSGALSGVASFTPVGTSHALAGAATIVTGAKTALDTNFLAKTTTANLVSAILQQYFGNIGKYAASLESQSDASLVVSIEMDKIQSYHATCGLGPAQASINSTVAPPTAPPSTPPAPPVAAVPAPPALPHAAVPAPPAPAAPLAQRLGHVAPTPAFENVGGRLHP